MRPGLQPTSCPPAARPPQPGVALVPPAVEGAVPLRPERAVQVVAQQPLNPEHFRLSPPCSHGRQKNRRK